MKRIGIIGGLSPESTVPYYLQIVREYEQKTGNADYPEIIIYSVCFGQYMQWMNSGDYHAIIKDLVKACNSLHNAGADFGLIATNTMHKFYKEVEEASPLPLLSIVEATGQAVMKKGLNKIGLMGTKFTMKDEFYHIQLKSMGIETIAPDNDEQESIHRIIFEELAKGILLNESRDVLKEIALSLNKKGAEGIILGCTELPLILEAQDVTFPLFDTGKIHAAKALKEAL